MSATKPKPIQTRQDLIEFYTRQALEQASWARPKRGKKASAPSNA